MTVTVTRPQHKAADFYAYIHCKPDGSPFYVGKGKGARCYRLKRDNPYHQRVVAKYGQQNILVGRLECSSEENAFKLEKGLIKCLRNAGMPIVNLTDGGDGASGHIHSEETKQRIGSSNSIKLKGRKPSEETCRKAIAAKTGSHLTDEQKARIGAGNKGKVRSEQFCEILRVRATGRKQSAEAIEKTASANRGMKRSEETKAKIRAAALRRYSK
jgi:hypothetical protein